MQAHASAEPGHDSRNGARARNPAAPAADREACGEPPTMASRGMSAGALPDLVLARIFECVGLPDAWRSRLVSRRVRATVEGIEWRALELSLEACNDGKPQEHARLDALAELVRRGRMRIAHGAAVRLSYRRSPPMLSLFAREPPAPRDDVDVALPTGDLYSASKDEDEDGWPRDAGGHEARELVRLRTTELSRAGVRLIAACSAASGGLGDVSIKLLTHVFKHEPAQHAREHAAHVLAVLAALQPHGRRAGAGPPPLRRLALRGTMLVLPGSLADWRPTAGESSALRTLLAPFSRLERLELTGAGFFPLDTAAAAALAEGAPQLRALEASFVDDRAMGALAPLAHLEELLPYEFLEGYCPGLAMLADGPAGRSLRRLGLGRHDTDFKLHPDDIRALIRMPALERIDHHPGGCIEFVDDCTDEDAARLAAMRSLRALELGLDAGVVRGAASAVRGMHSLERLGLYIVMDDSPDTIAAVVDLFAAAARPLRRLELHSLRRPLHPEIVRALLANNFPDLQELSLIFQVSSPADVLVYDALAELRCPHIWVKFPADGDALNGFARSVLQGRLPANFDVS